MMQIQQGRDICTVVVTVDATPEIMQELETHAREGLSHFQDFPGFVSGALHKSTDGGRLVQYLQWQTEAEHLACINHPRWDEFPSTKRFMDLVDSGKARMDVRIYDVIAAVD